MSSSASLGRHSSPYVASRLIRHHSPSVAVTLLMSPATPFNSRSLQAPVATVCCSRLPLSRHCRLMSPAPLFCCPFSSVKSSLLLSHHQTPVSPLCSCHRLLKSRSRSLYVILTPYVSVPPMSPLLTVTVHASCL